MIGIRVDAWEKTPEIVALHSAKEFGERTRLGYKGEGGQNYAFDLEITTKAGQAIRVEGKWNLSDAVGSWTEREGEHSRLVRQAEAVDLLIVVWGREDEDEVAARVGKATLAGLRTRLRRMAIEGPSVVICDDVADAVGFISYLRSRSEPLALRPLGKGQVVGATADIAQSQVSRVL